MDRSTRINAWYILAALLGVYLLHSAWLRTQTVETIPYSRFEADLDKGKIKDVTVGADTIRGT